MRARMTFPLGAGALLGGLAGVVVGLVDGARAAWVFGVDASGAAAVVALSVAVDTLAGIAAGTAVELVARLALWGRRVRAPLAARGLALLVAGAAAMAATVATIDATLPRHNRFLAAGLAALAG